MESVESGSIAEKWRGPVEKSRELRGIPHVAECLYSRNLHYEEKVQHNRYSLFSVFNKPSQLGSDIDLVLYERPLEPDYPLVHPVIPE